MSYNKNTKYSTLENFCLLTALGSGGTSKVFLGFNPVSKKYAAVKILRKMDPKDFAIIKNEVAIQATLGCNSNFLNIQEYYETASLIDVNGRVQHVTALILDLARGGDILLLIEKIGIFPEKLARTYFHQLVDAIEFLQNSEIAHRDIKPENIMLDENFCIKVADFGCAAKFSSTKQVFKSAAGTSKYFPPEVHCGFPYEGIQVDLFATAIVVFCMTVGHMPFTQAIETDGLYNMLINGKAKQFWKTHEDINKEQGGSGISTEFKEMMTRMLEPNPNNRLTIEDIKRTVWYKKSTYETSEIVKAIQKKLQ